MNQIHSLIEIGSKVRVKPELVGDRIPERLIELLSENPVGTVIDYKMTDGTGIGFVLELSDNSNSWFFFEEVVSTETEESVYGIGDNRSEAAMLTLKKVAFSNERRPKVKAIQRPVYVGNTMMELLNPFNFLRWLLYSLKDVY